MPYCNGCHPPQENAAPPGSQSSWHARWLRAHSRPRPAVPQRPAPAAPNCTGRSVPVAVLLQRLVPVVVQIAVAKPGRRSVPCYQPRSMQVAAQPDPAAAVDPETDFGGALDMSDRARTSSKQGRWGQWIPCLHVPAPVAGPARRRHHHEGPRAGWWLTSERSQDQFSASFYCLLHDGRRVHPRAARRAAAEGGILVGLI